MLANLKPLVCCEDNSIMDIEQFNTASSLTLPSIMQGRLAQNAACPALFNRGKRSYHDLQKKVVRGKDGSRYLNRAVRLMLRLVLVGFCVGGTALARADNELSPGMLAPGFELANLVDDTQRRALKDYSGQVVYLDFWASWCGPCLVAMPKIEALRQSINSDEFVVLAINVDRDLKKARKFLTKIGVGYDSLVDEQGRVSASYGLNAMPSSFVINRSGVVTKVHEGFREGDEDELRAHIQGVIDSGA
jgi:peroxiredoxin